MSRAFSQSGWGCTIAYSLNVGIIQSDLQNTLMEIARSTTVCATQGDWACILNNGVSAALARLDANYKYDVQASLFCLCCGDSCCR